MVLRREGTLLYALSDHGMCGFNIIISMIVRIFQLAESIKRPQTKPPYSARNESITQKSRREGNINGYIEGRSGLKR